MDEEDELNGENTLDESVEKAKADVSEIQSTIIGRFHDAASVRDFSSRAKAFAEALDSNLKRPLADILSQLVAGLLTAAATHPQDSATLVECFAAVAAIRAPPPAGKERVSGTRLLVSALRRFPEEEEMVVACCRSLSFVATGAEAQRAFEQEGGQELLMDAIAKYKFMCSLPF
eukprot:NODE_4898_length_745_cov_60.831897_g4542_i0.p1 GENE.NODE_4898_length_745_cov_60.831897_g4542_i0~~NODE_4898_length_745_cov_60.831897_g4542_i0.p1  ORF type:complete len:198 (-),score=55.04 NODE_4898_length_745_cov_60.831897_g4542_i0:151-672(-)